VKINHKHFHRYLQRNTADIASSDQFVMILL